MNNIKVDFGPGEDNITGDFFFRTNLGKLSDSCDYLVFTDSRGVTAKDRGLIGWAIQLSEYFHSNNIRYVTVCRPKNLTGLVTLYNFLELNKIQASAIIAQCANAEFVPKKQSLIDDYIFQAQRIEREIDFETIAYTKTISKAFDKFISEDLFIFKDLDRLIRCIFKKIDNSCKIAFVLGSMENIDPKIIRARAPKYFESLMHLNSKLPNLAACFNSILFCQPVNGKYTESNSFSSDGMHYNQAAHKSIYHIIKAMVSAHPL
jgi:hypothetical protein